MHLVESAIPWPAAPAPSLPTTLRPHAVEVKFLLPVTQAAAVAAWVRDRLEADRHGTGPHRDEYRTTTIYLDTPAFDTFHRRGSFRRAKYRVRRYGDADRAFVERKLRTKRLLVKRRTPVVVSGLGNSSPGPIASDDAAWFSRRVAARGLEPVCRVRYDRIARLLQTPEGQARLTIDTGLAAVRASRVDFRATGAEDVILAGQAILEMKFRVTMPGVFREAAELFALEPSRISKYRLAVQALELQPCSPS